MTGYFQRSEVIAAARDAAASARAESESHAPRAVSLDDFAGADDEAKYAAALSYIAAQKHPPVLELPNREITLKRPFSEARPPVTPEIAPKSIEQVVFAAIAIAFDTFAEQLEAWA